MQIIDDIKSLYNQITKKDLHDQIAFNELGYGRRVADRIYAFCPFCGQVLELNADQVEEVDGRFRLKDPVSCSCRKGLRYLRKGCLGLLEEEERKRISRQKKQKGQKEPAAQTEANPLAAAYHTIKVSGDAYKKRLQLSDDPAPVLPPSAEFNSAPGSVPGSVSGLAPGFGLQAAFIPDDFEPDMDPYDREALYEEQLLDDWVIASGGNPLDFGDRSDAFTDPFGFGDDFGGGDGGFGGFGGWGDGFGGGDD